ncbi:condensation domain-containing protein, partial [Streptomyces sp. NPDC048269]|uniref:condensation domain-containing protein n=1 Tax=Streptomyces sp. NPDC048269 TaxID=3155753 RepID=UPI0034184B51
MQQKTRLQDVLPLSPLQQGLLFHAGYDSQAQDLYTMQLVFDIEGVVDRAALRAAAAAVLHRHPNLRAGFRYRKNGDPVQLIPREVPTPWTETDLSDLPEEARKAEADRLVAEDHARRFDPARPPLMRFTLITLGPEHHRFVFTSHHILIDGWSRAVLVGELFELYGTHGDASALPRVTPYKEYLSWLGRQHRGTAEAAWQKALDGVDEPTLLAPLDPLRTPLPPERLRLRLTESESAALFAWARSRGLTVNAVVQAAWALVLGQHTGRDDVVFGGTVSGRPPEIPGVESMVGLFINTLPVRVRIDPLEPLGALVDRIQLQQAELMDHQYLGLTDVQAQTSVTGELFDTLLVFENYPVDTESLRASAGGLGIVDASSDEGTHYPVTLMVTSGATLDLELCYRFDLFDQPRVEALGRSLLALLSDVPAGAETPVGRLALTQDQDARRVLESWNDTARDVAGSPLPVLFEEQVARTPDAVAVV